MSSSSTRHTIAFRLVALGCGAFVALTLLAMFLFTGGTQFDHSLKHYEFFNNFFSDLGGTRTPTGATNRLPMLLFICAMTAAASSTAGFFWAMQHFHRENAFARRVSRIAAMLGLLVGIGFVGVAATPWNKSLPVHLVIVVWTFRLLFVAVVLAAVLMWREKSMPRRFAVVFAVLAGLLLGYTVLLVYGPKPHTPQGRVIQVVGQKIIVYSAILAIGWQTLAADRLLRRSDAMQHSQPPASS